MAVRSDPRPFPCGNVTTRCPRYACHVCTVTAVGDPNPTPQQVGFAGGGSFCGGVWEPVGALSTSPFDQVRFAQGASHAPQMRPGDPPLEPKVLRCQHTHQRLPLPALTVAPAPVQQHTGQRLGAEVGDGGRVDDDGIMHGVSLGGGGDAARLAAAGVIVGQGVRGRRRGRRAHRSWRQSDRLATAPVGVGADLWTTG